VTRQETVSKAIEANVGQSVRSEDFGSYHDFFVEPLEPKQLEGNASQVIYGRRGSGKTLLLRTINDLIESAFPERKAISFYYTATDFRSSPEIDGVDVSVKVKTHAFFHYFIEKLSRDLFELADRVIARPELLDRLGLGGSQNSKKRDELATLALELVEEARYGSELPMPGALQEQRSERHRTNRKATGSAGLMAGANVVSGPSAGVTLEGGMGKGSSHDTEEQKIFTPSRHFSPGRAKDRIRRMIDLLDLDCLIIFIDEWMSLAECQVEFAERLKLTLFGEGRIAVKIAADQYQGHLGNSGQGQNFRGLEVGADIFVAVDLDHPFRAEDKRHMLLEALYRRLLFFEPELEHHFGRPPLANQEIFFESLFATQRAFNELCNGAQGLFRDFHLIFQDCSKLIGENVTDKRIDFEVVRSAIVNSTQQAYRRIARSRYSNALLYQVISPHVQATGSKFFLTDLEPGPVVAELLSKRLIHHVPTEDLHASIRGSCDCFEIHHGIYLDLLRAAESSDSQRTDLVKAEEVTGITSMNKPTFMIDLSILEELIGDDVEALVCPHCDEEFLSSQRAYVVRRLCPHCFERQEA
jgi:hypothetical protein